MRNTVIYVAPVSKPAVVRVSRLAHAPSALPRVPLVPRIWGRGIAVILSRVPHVPRIWGRGIAVILSGVPHVPRIWGRGIATACRFAAFALLLFALSPLSAQQSKPWEQIPIPTLHEFHPQQPKRIELKNGIVIFLQEDHELPFISGAVLIPGGSRDESLAKTGLVGLYGQAWRTSGSEKMDGDAMDDLLEAKA